MSPPTRRPLASVYRPLEPTRRRPSARVRRRRVAAISVVLVAIAGIAVLIDRRAPSRPHRALTAPPGAAAPIPAIEAGLLPWSLDAPLSRAVVLPGAASTVTVAGGLSSAQQSLARIFSLDTTTGQAADLGHLAAGAHDAAGAQLAGADLILGGGSANTMADVQRFIAAPAAAATVVGRLRAPRSDSVAV